MQSFENENQSELNSNQSSKQTTNSSIQDDCSPWYLAKATPFHEKSAIEWLKLMAKDENCEEDIKEYFIPQVAIDSGINPALVISTDGGQVNKAQNEKSRSFMVGYFAVKLNFSSSLKKVLYKIQRSINSKYKIIIFTERPMTKTELEKMKNSSNFVQKKDYMLYNPGDEVIITHESFPNMVATVMKVDEKCGKISVVLDILGRSVPLELEISKVKKKKQDF